MNLEYTAVHHNIPKCAGAALALIRLNGCRKKRFNTATFFFDNPYITQLWLNLKTTCCLFPLKCLKIVQTA
jgi:hypothetical protein